MDLDRLQQVLGRPVSQQQAAVVTAPLSAGVVVAGAGSGKTATMVARVLWLVGNGLVSPAGVLGLTFTSKAAEELAGRVRAGLAGLRRAGLLPDEQADQEPTVSTYHAYAGRLLRDHALRLGREPAARIITPASSWQLAARVVAGYDGPMDAVTWTEATVVRAVIQLAGELAEHLCTAGQVRALSDRLRTAPDVGAKLAASLRAREQLLPLVAGYAQAKGDRELLDFGDVVALAAELARDHPAVGESERAAFPVVLLDEYQDTGTAQEVLLAALFGGGHAVTAVGDPCQSIYGWRGASAGTLRRFPRAFNSTRPAGSLSTTYRSGGRLLLLANLVADELRDEGVPVERLTAAPGREHEGEVVAALLGDLDSEAAWVACQVHEAVLRLPGQPGQPGPTDLDPARPGLPGGRSDRPDQPHWSRAAVLCRKRSMFPRLREAFERRGVPVEVVGLGGLLDVPEVADVLATLRVLDDPAADTSLLRLLTGPRWRLGPRDLAALGNHARQTGRRRGPGPVDPLAAVVLAVDDERGGSLVEALDDLPPAQLLSPEGLRRLRALRDELAGLRRRMDVPLPELVADVERTLGLDVEVGARPGADPAAARADLDAFAAAAAEFSGDVAQDGTGDAVLGAFLAFLAAAEDEEHGLDLGAVSAADTVKLMTVHAAKGLEWPVVAVPGLASSTGRGSQMFPAAGSASWTENPRLLPYSLRGDRDDLPELAGPALAQLKAHAQAKRERDAREERRLAYVAFTRAQQVLLCSGFHRGDGTQPVGPSVFLAAAAQACRAGAGRVDRWEDPPDQAARPAATPVAWPLPEPPAAPAVRLVADRVRELIRGGVPTIEPAGLTEATRSQVAGWDQDLRRLAEEERRRRTRSSRVHVPEAMAVTRLVELERDPAGLAAHLLRPMPRRPSPVARRGTAFHAWLEQAVFGRPQLLDPDELPGSADEGAATDADLAALQEAFLASRWASRSPSFVEEPFELQLAGVVLRGRVDAAFRDEDGGWTLVDWKTGHPPAGERARSAAIQLAAYRLAWAELRGAPLELVRACFHYVAQGLTICPADLRTRAELEALLLGLPGEDPVEQQ